LSRGIFSPRLSWFPCLQICVATIGHQGLQGLNVLWGRMADQTTAGFRVAARSHRCAAVPCESLADCPSLAFLIRRRRNWQCWKRPRIARNVFWHVAFMWLVSGLRKPHRLQIPVPLLPAVFNVLRTLPVGVKTSLISTPAMLYLEDCCDNAVSLILVPVVFCWVTKQPEWSRF
jgi:hypothetical protein